MNDETTASFCWAMDRFKRIMGGKCPSVLFSDQDPAIADAAERTFVDSTTGNRCAVMWDQWHMEKHLQQHCGGSDNSMYRELMSLMRAANIDEATSRLDSFVSAYPAVKYVECAHVYW